jgi:hypothetical protein
MPRHSAISDFMKSRLAASPLFGRCCAGLPKRLEGLKQDVRASSDGVLPTKEADRGADAVKSNWQWVDNDS